ncbi:MAG: hypothetical protein QY323_05695 [Patescibacteria group bacterium]|nr:MAG: hypothetical protein QY323_05695 [Patescibacteria group bacterium]
MSRRTRKRPPRYVRETTEARLSDRLCELGVKFTQSTALDHVYKIDILVQEIEPLAALRYPIGVQITQKRDAAEKIRTFYERSRNGTRGPLLYVEVHGRVTLEMSVALRSALIALWLEAPRQRTREHRLAITQSGTFWWLPARADPKTP